MDFTDYFGKTTQLGAELANTLGAVSGKEDLVEPKDVQEFLARWEIPVDGRVTEDEAAGIRALRDDVRKVFEAPTVAEAAAIVNEMIRDSGTLPNLTDHDGHWHLHYTSADAPLVDRVAAIVGMVLAGILTEDGLERFGICAADNCKDVFVDTSKNRSRRFCNETCSTRTNVAAYRARKK